MSKRSIIGDQISSKFFTFVRDAEPSPFAMFVSELSTLEGNGFRPTKRVWSDSMDSGFVMVSAKTGEEAVFTLVDTIRDADGDLVKYVFAPVFSTVQRLRGLATCAVHIYNT